jgi:hypothetical protein
VPHPFLEYRDRFSSSPSALLGSIEREGREEGVPYQKAPGYISEAGEAWHSVCKQCPPLLEMSNVTPFSGLKSK